MRILPKFLRSYFGFLACAAFFQLSAATAPAQVVAVAPVPAGECASVRNLRLADVSLTEVADIPDSLEHGDNVRAPHCRVSGIIGRSTAFTAMLPKHWNKRMLMGGNGGYAGTINRAILANATAGYLTVSTNTGHERQVDFGYLAVHRTAETAKSLARAFYGAEPTYSYFSGCSNGGRQGLMEAERFPDDFDGIVSGAPAAHMSKTGASFLKNTQAAFPNPSYFDHP